MTIQFVAGMLIGMALTFFGVSSVAGYLSSKELKKSERIMDLIEELNHYKSLYQNHRDNVDSGY